MITWWFGNQPESIHDYGWGLHLDGQLLWQTIIDRIAAMHSSESVVVLGRSQADKERYCAKVGVRHFTGSSLAHAQCLSDLFRLHDEPMISIHPLLLLVLDIDGILDRIQNALDNSNSIVSIVDLPQPLYTIALTSPVLELYGTISRDSFLSDYSDDGLARWLNVYDNIRAKLSNDLPNVHKLHLDVSTSSDSSGRRFYLEWKNRQDFDEITNTIARISDRTFSVVLENLQERALESSKRRYRLVAPKRKAFTENRNLFASNPSAFSGSEQCLTNSVAAIKSVGLEPHCLIAQQGLFASKVAAAGAKVHCPQRDFGGTGVDSSLLTFRYLNAISPAILHCNASVGPHLLGHSKALGIPIIQWARKANVSDMREHYLIADRITAVSRFVKDRIESELGCEGKVEVVYDCVDTEYFHPSAFSDRCVRKELDIGENTFVILCVARFVSYKHHLVLVKAFGEISSVLSNACLILIGEPDLIEPLVFEDVCDVIGSLGLTERVRMVKFDADIRSYEQAADVVVLCSECEPLGTVVLESMSLGKAIVVTDSGGLPEMIDGDVSGLVSRVGSVESLTEKLLLLATDADFRSQLGLAARRVAQDRFSLATHAQQLAELYTRVNLP